MTTPCGRYTIVYNGEVYNFCELRKELERHGIAFQSHSDTEVILHAYARWKLEAFSRFNGMYALGIWDHNLRELVLARDRFGIKPLYWARLHGELIFGSEIKALLSAGLTDRSINLVGLNEYLYFGNALGRHTLFSRVNRLLPDHVLICRHGQAPVEQPVPRAATILPGRVTLEEASEEVEARLYRAVQRHMISDVPIALLLSSGLDSSSIGLFASRDHALTTVSIGFEGKHGIDELDDARNFATRHLHATHIEHVLEYRDLTATLESVTRAHDQPFGDAANVPLYLIGKEIGKDYKVILQGDGGDEIFGGYRRYALLRHARLLRRLAHVGHVPTWLAKMSPLLRRLRRMEDAFAENDVATRSGLLLTEEWVGGGLLRALCSPELAARLSETDPLERYRTVIAELEEADPVQAQLVCDTKILLPDIFLEKVDRPTMAHGLEVRVPMLDGELSDFVMALPSHFKVGAGKTKRVLRVALEKHAPSALLKRKKRGFGVPYGRWLAGPLRGLLSDMLLDRHQPLASLLDRQFVHRLVIEHETGKLNHGFVLYKLLMLAMWARAYSIDGVDCA